MLIKANISTITDRITVVDALRGFAIMSIMLLHNIEHFDYYYFPEYLPEWMKTLDKKVWEVMFALFSGKAYAIFAVLFGLTFFIMDNKQQIQGNSFGGRFMWRMLLLLGFGAINSFFYSGDILAIYAVLGFSLVLVSRLNNKMVLAIAIVLLLQPLEIGRFIYLYIHPEYEPGYPLSWQYFGRASAYLSSNSFFTTAWGNFTNGRWACTLWFWENGRFFQTPALFMSGMLLGRTYKFTSGAENRKFWRTTLIVSAMLSVILFVLIKMLPGILNDKMSGQANMVLKSWNGFTLTFVWISAFVLLYHTRLKHKLLSNLEVYGKMTLTSYVMQSILGCFVYNACGLALYQYTGATLSLLVGIVLFVFQYNFCKWWLSTHTQGSLEFIWHKLTWLKRRYKMDQKDVELAGTSQL